MYLNRLRLSYKYEKITKYFALNYLYMERTGFILQNECNFKAGGRVVTLLRSAKVSHICNFGRHVNYAARVY